MMGMAWLLRKAYDAEVECFYDGKISHPQNLAMENLLEPELKRIEEYDPKGGYGCRILVDTVPAHAGVGKNEVDFDLDVDHHKEVPNGGFKGLFVNLKAGSCAATVYHIIKQHDVKFDDNIDRDCKVATAILVGITTDTENMLSDDTTEYEFRAYQELFEFRDSTALKKIINYKRPKSWIDAYAEAAHKAIVNEDGIGVVGIGFIKGSQRDLIADIADSMSSWVNVDTAIAFAVVDGDRIEGSVRSTNPSLSVPGLCKELGGKCGTGGGKLGKGAYRYGLGGIALDEDDEDETRHKFWECLREKETKRILRVAKK